jgi:hypothetical protein
LGVKVRNFCWLTMVEVDSISETLTAVQSNPTKLDSRKIGESLGQKPQPMTVFFTPDQVGKLMCLNQEERNQVCKPEKFQDNFSDTYLNDIANFISENQNESKIDFESNFSELFNICLRNKAAAPFYFLWEHKIKFFRLPFTQQQKNNIYMSLRKSFYDSIKEVLAGNEPRDNKFTKIQESAQFILDCINTLTEKKNKNFIKDFFYDDAQYVGLTQKEMIQIALGVLDITPDVEKISIAKILGLVFKLNDNYSDYMSYLINNPSSPKS